MNWYTQNFYPSDQLRQSATNLFYHLYVLSSKGENNNIVIIFTNEQPYWTDKKKINRAEKN